MQTMKNVKLSRLKLASLTEKTLKQGLELLGIKDNRKNVKKVRSISTALFLYTSTKMSIAASPPHSLGAWCNARTLGC